MPNGTKVGENPNDKMPPGRPLGHDEVAGAQDDTATPSEKGNAETHEDEDRAGS